MNPSDEPLDANSQAILEAVIALIFARGDSMPYSLVDIGCGEGHLLKVLKDKCDAQLAGVGWNARIPTGVKAYNHIDLSGAGWADCLAGLQFDWVVSTEVLEHLVNPYQFFIEIRRLISDTGRLLLTFPNVHNWRSILGYAIGGRFSGFFGPNFNSGHPLYDQHIFIPNHHLIRYLLLLTGFQIEIIKWVNGNSRLTAQTTLLIAYPVEIPRIS